MGLQVSEDPWNGHTAASQGPPPWLVPTHREAALGTVVLVLIKVHGNDGLGQVEGVQLRLEFRAG